MCLIVPSVGSLVAQAATAHCSGSRRLALRVTSRSLDLHRP